MILDSGGAPANGGSIRRSRTSLRCKSCWRSPARCVTVVAATAAVATTCRFVLQGFDSMLSLLPSSRESYMPLTLPMSRTGTKYDPSRSLLMLHPRQAGDGTAAKMDPSKHLKPSETATVFTELDSPPMSACFGRAKDVKPYLTQFEGKEVIRTLVEGRKRYLQRQAQQQEKGSLRSPSSPSINKSELLRLLLREAAAKDRFLFTLQIGGHDGKSNDPMYNALVRDTNNNNINQTLENWLPVVAEPVGHNFGRLLQTYQDIDRDRILPCQLPVRWAMSYDNESSDYGAHQGHVGTCPFYRFNVDESAPTTCRDKPYVVVVARRVTT
jgi:hypothetical protein